MVIPGFNHYNPPGILQLQWFDYFKYNPNTNHTPSDNNKVTPWPRPFDINLYFKDLPYRAMFYKVYRKVSGGYEVTLYTVYSKYPTTDLFRFEYQSNYKFNSTGNNGAILAKFNQTAYQKQNDVRVYATSATYKTSSETCDFGRLTYGTGKELFLQSNKSGSDYYFYFDFAYLCAAHHQQNAKNLELTGLRDLYMVPYPYMLTCAEKGNATATYGNIPKLTEWEIAQLGKTYSTPSGNYSRTDTDMQWNDSGFEISIGRTYNSRDKKASIISPGWRFSLEGKVEVSGSDVTVWLPNGAAQIFKASGSTYTAYNSHSTLVKTGSTYTLTTHKQYVYGFNDKGYLIWMKDRNGNTVNFAVDANGKVTSITDTAGRVTTVSYNNNRISRITDAAGRVVTYEYNTANHLSKVTDPNGKNTYYSYDGGGNLTQVSNHNNANIERITYSTPAGQVLPRMHSVTDQRGRTQSYSYNNTERTISISDSGGRTTKTWFDTEMYPVREQDAEGRNTIMEYVLTGGVNRHGDVRKITDRNGNVTTYDRDAQGNILKVTNPDGSTRTYTYDTKNNLLSEKEETGRMKYYRYDSAMINCITEATPLDGKTPYSESANQSLFAITKRVYYTASEAAAMCGRIYHGLLKSQTDPMGNTYTYQYDNRGYLKSATNPLGKTRRYEYNIVGWLKRETTARGYHTNYYYDKNGNRLKNVSHANETSRSIYNILDQLVQEVSPQQYSAAVDTTTFTSEHIVSAVGAYGDAVSGTRYAYTPDGLVTRKTDPLNCSHSYTYDVYGNMLTETRPDKSIIAKTYDAMDRVKKISIRPTASSGEVPQEEHTYTVLNDGKTRETVTRYLTASETAVTVATKDYTGRIILLEKPDNSTIKTEFYANGLVKRQTNERGYITQMQYNYNGILIHKWEQTGDGQYKYTGWEYDKANRLTKTIECKEYVPLGTIPEDQLVWKGMRYNADSTVREQSDSAGGQTTYSYDNDGNIVKESRLIEGSIRNDMEYTLDHMGLVTKKTICVEACDIGGNDSTLTPLQTMYTRDKNGNVLTETDTENHVIRFVYDHLNQLVQTETVGLDENGEGVVITTTKTYDWKGRVIKQTNPNGDDATSEYDVYGNLIKSTDYSGNTTLRDYDLAGRLLIKVSPANYRPGAAVTSMSRTIFTYDKLDRVVRETIRYIEPGVTSQWSEFVISSCEYDPAGNVIINRDALGHTGGYGTIMTYDGLNRLITVTDPEGQKSGLDFTQKLVYDGLGRKTQEIDALGNSTFYTYNDRGDITCVATKADESGDVLERHTYNQLGKLTSSTNALGFTTTFEYNALGLLRKTVLPGDDTIPVCTYEITYTRTGLPARTISSTGFETIVIYDQQGRARTETKRKTDGSDSISTHKAYDKAGNLRFITNPNGCVIERVYNPSGLLRSSSTTVSGKEKTISYTYDAEGRLLSVIDAFGRAYTQSLDPLGRITQKKDPYGVVYESMQYNNNHAPISQTDALGRVTRYSYDRNNRQTQVTDPVGDTTSFSYDAKGNPISITNGRHHTLFKSYNRYGQLLGVKDTDDNVLSGYEYDLCGKMTSQTDGAGNVTRYSYNARGLEASRTDPAGYVELILYNGDGLPVSKTDRNGNVTVWEYDVHGRRISEAVNDNTYSYSYDKIGNRLSMTDATGITTYTYDEENRLLMEETPGIGLTSYRYDITEQLPKGSFAVQCTDPKGNTVKKIYDRAGRLSMVQNDLGTTAYQYYDNGAQQRIVYPNGATVEYEYFDNDKLKALVNIDPNHQIINRYEYFYDAAGNMSRAQDETGETAFSYDSLNRLIGVKESDGHQTDYIYDLSGNRTRKTLLFNDEAVVSRYHYNALNQMTQVETEHSGGIDLMECTYDPNGNLIRECCSRLQPITGEQAKFSLRKTAPGLVMHEYDARNRLVFSKSNDGKSVRNHYNGDGRRIAKTVNGVTTKFLHGPQGITLELNKNGMQTALNTYGNALVSRKTKTNAYTFFYNGHGDVTNLLDVNSNVVAKYTYDAFGVPKLAEENANNPYRYAGYRFDCETGLYDLKARYYDPVTARFLQEDTYRGNPEDPLSLHLYTYCLSNPLRYYDPTGHKSRSVGAGKPDKPPVNRYKPTTTKTSSGSTTTRYHRDGSVASVASYDKNGKYTGSTHYSASGQSSYSTGSHKSSSASSSRSSSSSSGKPGVSVIPGSSATDIIWHESGNATIGGTLYGPDADIFKPIPSRSKSVDQNTMVYSLAQSMVEELEGPAPQKLTFPGYSNRITTEYLDEQYLSDFGFAHYGIDLGTTYGKAVYALGDGTVLFADWDATLGYVIDILYKNVLCPDGRMRDIVVKYAHLEKGSLNVSAGDYIHRYDGPVATMGKTGALKNMPVHLHLEMYIYEPKMMASSTGMYPSTTNGRDSVEAGRNTGTYILDPMTIMYKMPDMLVELSPNYTFTNTDISKIPTMSYDPRTTPAPYA